VAAIIQIWWQLAPCGKLVLRKRGFLGLSVLEICAGGGGQAVGLEQAGFEPAGLLEIDQHACNTLRHNRPQWNVFQADIREFSAKEFRGIDLLAGGVPCPPFSIAGKQLGPEDERDLFPEALRLVRESQPAAVMLENVAGFASARFADYRRELMQQLHGMGYDADWQILNASSFRVPQLRPRFILVAVKQQYAGGFPWPSPLPHPPTVAETIGDLMASREWPGAPDWMRKAAGIAPTIVGGSKKHGGPDLGPTRARTQWALLGVDGLGIANEPPDPEFPENAKPRLTVQMVARLQGFPEVWTFTGGKTAAYRQVGNALPPPVANAVAANIRDVLTGTVTRPRSRQAALFGAFR
jgi:DNA (cytosine-5)-methyltransferase 1